MATLKNLGNFVDQTVTHRQAPNPPLGAGSFTAMLLGLVKFFTSGDAGMAGVRLEVCLAWFLLGRAILFWARALVGFWFGLLGLVNICAVLGLSARCVRW